MKNQTFDWGAAGVDDNELDSGNQFNWGDDAVQPVAPDHVATERPKSLFDRADEAIYGMLGDNTPIDIAKKIATLPSKAMQGFEHGLSSVNTQIAGLEATLREIPGTKTDAQREAEKQNLINQSRYRAQREKSMGTIGQLTSLATQIAPHVLASPVVGPAGAFAMGTGTTIGDIGARQIEKYGEVDPSTALQYGGLSGAIDLGLSAATRGLVNPRLTHQLAKTAAGVGESMLSAGQQSLLSDVGAGDEADWDKAFEAASMGGLIRTGFEGANFKLNPEGLKGAEESRKILNEIGIDPETGNIFSQNVGRGRNSIKNYEDEFLNSSAERGQQVYTELSDYLGNTPEGQDAVTAEVMKSLNRDLKDKVTLANFNYETNDGRNVGEVLGLDPKAMDKAVESIRDVREPLFGRDRTIEKNETTQSDLGSLREAFHKSVRNDFKAHTDNISVIDGMIDKLSNLGVKNKNDDANIAKLNLLKKTLNALNTANRDVMKPGIGSEHADAIPMYAARAMRLAAETGLLQTGKLRGMTDAGFNPTMDFHYMQGKMKSGMARDDQIIEGSQSRYQKSSPDLSPFEKAASMGYGQFQSMLGGRRISKERAKGSAVFDKYGDLLVRPEGPRPDPTPDDVVKAAVDTGDMDLASRVAEEALAEDGLSPIRTPAEDVETANARVDDIVATPEEKAAQAATETATDIARSEPLSPANLRAADARPEPEVAPEAARVPEEQIQDPREFIDLTGRPTTPEPEVTPAPEQAPMKPLDQMNEEELRQFISEARARLGEEPEVPVIKIDEESVREAKGEPSLAQRPTEVEPEVAPVEPEVTQPRVSPEDRVRAPEKPSKPVEEEVSTEPQPKAEEPVEAPTEAPVEEPKAKKKPDLAEAPKKEEPEIKEPEEAAEPVKEEAPKKKPTLAEKPEEVKPKSEPEEVKEEVKPAEEEKVEPVKEEKPKARSERLPTRVSDVTKALEAEATKLENLPIKKLLGTEHAHAMALRDASEHIKQQTDSLIAREALTEKEGAALADELIQSLGGMDGIKNLKTFKKEFSLDRLELLRNKRRAAAEERAKARLEKATDADKRKAERRERDRAERAAHQENLSRESHDTVNRYAKEEGFSQDDLTTALKKHGYTSKDVVNPVKIRAELERMKRERLEKQEKETTAELERTLNDAEITKQRQELEAKIDETSQQIGELATAIKGLTGQERSSAVRRKQALSDKLISLNRAKEDIGELGSAQAVQRKLDALRDKIKTSERNLSDIEAQIKHIERAMSDVEGVTPEIISNYLAQFDIRTLPLEKLDHARNKAISFAEKEVGKIKEAKDAAIREEAEALDQGAKESLDAVKDSDDSAEVLGTFDQIEKFLKSVIDKPSESQTNVAMAKVLERMANTAKRTNALTDANKRMWSKYFDVMEEALKRRSMGVPDKYLVSDSDLNQLRDLYQNSRGREEHSSADAGQMWTRLKTTLTGDKYFEFAKIKQHELEKILKGYKEGVLSEEGKPKKKKSRLRSSRLKRGDVDALKGLF